MATRLPAELIALMSQVSLSESDWWYRSLRQAIVAALAVSPAPLLRADLRASLADDFSVQISDSELRDQLEVLLQDGNVLEASDSRVKLSQAEAAMVANRAQEQEDLESAALDRFNECVAAAGLDPGLLDWDSINNDLVSPLIRSLGVETYRFIEGEKFNLDLHPQAEAFLDRLDTSLRQPAKQVVVGFLDPNNDVARRYVLSRLTTYFFIEASRTTPQTLAQISKLTGERPEFDILVDTNLLFSFLELQHSPENEAAQAMLLLQKQIAAEVGLSFYVTRETLNEARRALQNTVESLRGIVLTRNVIEGTSRIVFSGLAQHFIDQAAYDDGIRDPAQFFAPYIDNLLSVIRDYGIELYNVDLDPYHTRQDVVDDLNSQLSIINAARKRKGLPEKAYEQVRHDVVLWHLVRDRRPDYVDSPLNAKYWAATLDYSLLAFDRTKRRSRTDIPVCMHPSALLQMLRFWTPSGRILDSAIVGTLRLPLLFLEFDVELEKTTISLLKTLSRFENHERLSASTIARMVVSDQLRRRMTATAVEQQIDLVKIELLEESARLGEELDAKERQIAVITADSENAEKHVETLSLEVAALRDQMTELQATAAAATERAQQEATRVVQAEIRTSELAAVVKYVLPVCAAVVVVGVAIVAVGRVLEWKVSLVTAVIVVAIGIGLSILVRLLSGAKLTPEPKWVASLRSARKWVWGVVLLTIVLGFFTNWVYDDLRDRRSEPPRPSESRGFADVCMTHTSCLRVSRA